MDRNSFKGKKVVVRLSDGTEVAGICKLIDQHMNVVLTDAEEIRNGNRVAKLGTVLIRGSHVVMIQDVESGMINAK